MTPDATPLKIATIALDIKPLEPRQNLAQAECLIYQLPEEVDVIVLPELFSTSFVPDTPIDRYAESDNGPTLTAVRQFAADRKALIAGSFAAKDGDNYFNRGFMISPDGAEAFYDKRHLFSVSDEAKIFTKGTKPMPVVEYKGWNLSMMICYDLRFPVWSRNIGHRYDALLVPANWPQSRGYAWTHLLIARAIENQAVVVGANRGGSDQFGDYAGMSQIFDPLGMPVGITDNASAMIGAVTPAELDEARRRLPAQFDADDFAIL